MLKSGSRPAACQVDPAVSSARSTQHDVRPAFVGEMVERADADHAAADHHDAGMSFHVTIPDANAHRSVASGRCKQDANSDNP